MPTNAVVIESARFYEDMSLTRLVDPPLPPGTKIALGKAFGQSVAVTLPDGKQGFIDGETKIRSFQHIILQQESAPAYEQASAKSTLLGHYSKGDELWIAGSTKGPDRTWIEVRDPAGNPSFIDGDVQVLFVDKLRESIAKAMGAGRDHDLIVKDLTKSGVPPAVAQRLCQEMHVAIANLQSDPEFRSKLAGKYARRMVYGVLWAVGGTIATVWSFESAYSSRSGGTYFIFWGAIVWGIIDFFRGLGGWAKYKGR